MLLFIEYDESNCRRESGQKSTGKETKAKEKVSSRFYKKRNTEEAQISTCAKVRTRFAWIQIIVCTENF